MAKRAAQGGISTARRMTEAQQKAIRVAIVEYLVGWLRPYQLKWIQDTSQQKAANWARQTGKSEALGLEVVLQALEPPPTPDHCEIIISASEKQAKEIMMKAARWARWVDEIARSVAGVSVFDGVPTSEKITFFNGVRIISLSSNPNTIAGYHGDVFWDEAAKTPRDDDIWDAIHPIISAGGYRLRITSTPWGDAGKFYEVFTKLPDWSKHTVNIIEAVDQGAPHNVRQLRGQYDPITWAQNYMCKFLSNLTAAFPRDLIKACTELYESVQLPPHGAGRTGIGMDIGRVHDRTAIVWTTEWPDGFYRTTKVKHLDKMPFALQERYVKDILKAGGIDRMWIDGTGIGMQMAENLQNAYPGIVEPIMFTNSRKLDLVTGLVAQMERGTFAMQPDNDLVSDLTSIRAHFLQGSKNIRYDSDRNQSGHADSAWAAMLSLGSLTGSSDWLIGGVRETTQNTFTQDPTTPGLSILSSVSADGEERMPTASDIGVESLDPEELKELYGNDPEMLSILLGES